MQNASVAKLAKKHAFLNNSKTDQSCSCSLHSAGGFVMTCTYVSICRFQKEG